MTGPHPAVAATRVAVRAGLRVAARAARWSWSPAAAAPTRWRSPPPPRSRRRGPGCGPGRSSSTTGCRPAPADVAGPGGRLLPRPRAGPGPTCCPVTVRAAGEGPEAAARDRPVRTRWRRAARRARRRAGAARAHPRRPGRAGAARPRPRLRRPVAVGYAAPPRPASRARCWTCPRATTEAACAARGLDPWDDPHNARPGLPPGAGPRACWRRSSATSARASSRPSPARPTCCARTPTCSTGSPARPAAASATGPLERRRARRARPTRCARGSGGWSPLEAGVPGRCAVRRRTSTRSTRWSVRAGGGRARCDLPGGLQARRAGGQVLIGAARPVQ